jgi:hypothetical protein
MNTLIMLVKGPSQSNLRSMYRVRHPVNVLRQRGVWTGKMKDLHRTPHLPVLARKLHTGIHAYIYIHG